MCKQKACFLFDAKQLLYFVYFKHHFTKSLPVWDGPLSWNEAWLLDNRGKRDLIANWMGNFINTKTEKKRKSHQLVNKVSCLKLFFCLRHTFEYTKCRDCPLQTPLKVFRFLWVWVKMTVKLVFPLRYIACNNIRSIMILVSCFEKDKHGQGEQGSTVEYFLALGSIFPTAGQQRFEPYSLRKPSLHQAGVNFSPAEKSLQCVDKKVDLGWIWLLCSPKVAALWTLQNAQLCEQYSPWI